MARPHPRSRRRRLRGKERLDSPVTFYRRGASFGPLEPAHFDFGPRIENLNAASVDIVTLAGVGTLAFTVAGALSITATATIVADSAFIRATRHSAGISAIAEIVEIVLGGADGWTREFHGTGYAIEAVSIVLARVSASLSVPG